MNKSLSDITMVVDRSGSMQACREEAQVGVNSFIREQKEAEGEAVMTLVQFDNEYEFVHKGVPIQDVPEYILKPRGMTALLDAVGRAIQETGERLEKTPEADRPGLVVFAIITDGQENASREYTKDKIKEMISRQQKEYSWQFTYLGANQDSFAEATSMGIPTAGTANYVQQNAGVAFAAASSNVMRMRVAAASGQVVYSSYTEEERESMNNVSPEKSTSS